MYAWEEVQKTIDYIEEHLTEEIAINELAGIASLSPFYFQRLFKKLVKKPVAEYIKLRRLSAVCEMLLSKQIRIADAALEYGFSSHSNFTRSFKEAYGITPEEYRESGTKLNHFVKPELVLEYVMVGENVPVITDGMIIEISRRHLEKPRMFAGFEGEIPIEELMGGLVTGVSAAGKLWERLHCEREQIPNRLKNGNDLGALYMNKAGTGKCMYMAAAEVDAEASIDGYDMFQLPAASYIVCGFAAESFDELVNSAVFKANRFMERWMSEHQLTTEDFAVEVYYPPKDGAAYLEQWMIPVPIKS